MISPAFHILAALPFKVTPCTLFSESPGKHSALGLGVDWSLRVRARPVRAAQEGRWEEIEEFCSQKVCQLLFKWSEGTHRLLR